MMRLHKAVAVVLCCCFLIISKQAFSEADPSKKNPSTKQEVSSSSKSAEAQSSKPNSSTISNTETTQKEDNAKQSKSSTRSQVKLASDTAPSGVVPQNIASTRVQVEPFTGSANLSYPIQVPPGRAGIQPNIALTYSSSNRGLGLAGVGWNLDLGSIQRSTKKGVPSYDDSKDSFVMVQGSSQDLIADPNNPKRYYPEIEGAFSKIEKVSDHWEMTDKKGTKYYFGNTEDSKQNDPSNPSHIFRWALNRVEDLNGNYMTIVYMKDQGQIYPQTVSYTGISQEVVVPFAQVSINLAASTVSSSSYITAFKVVTAKRIDNISVSVNSNLQTKYVFRYQQSIDTQRDLLQSIQQIGSDGKTSLPEVRFEYSQVGRVFKEENGWQIPSGIHLVENNHDSGLRIADINSDGYPDFITSLASTTNSIATTNVYLHNKNNAWLYDAAWSAVQISGFRLSSSLAVDLGLRLMDINGDGYTDAIQNYKQTSNGSRVFLLLKKVWLNNGYNLELTDKATLPQNTFFAHLNLNLDFNLPDTSPCNKNRAMCNVSFGDINGDNFPDIISNYLDSKIYINLAGEKPNQIEWKEDDRYSVPKECDFIKGTLSIDVNGDGLVDILSIQPGNSFLYINTGTGWFKDSDSSWLKGLSDINFSYGATVTDINGDGLLDIVASASKVFLNTGNGWVEAKGYFLPAWNYLEGLSQFFDANGDGLNDYMVFSDSNNKLYLNPGPVPSDTIIKINNGIGSQSSIDYDYSTHYQNTFLPFPIPVVKSLTTTVAGDANSYVTRYEYSGGLWDSNYREFVGFKTVKVIDALGNYTVSAFSQDHWMKGRPLEQASYDKDGKLFSKSTSQWQTQNILTNGNQISKFAYLARSDNYLYDGQATPKRTAQEFTYGQSPQYGDPTQVINYGEVDPATGADIGTDKITTQTEYVNNPTLWLLGLPKMVTTSDYAGKPIGRTWFYYDGALDNNAVPSLGRLTKKIDWLGLNNLPPTTPQASDPQTKYSYDSYGNLQSTTDALNNTTSIVYDNTVHMFPVKVTNALNQVTSTSYYGIDGVPLDDGAGLHGLWGQSRSSTDANKQTAYSVYDGFGRLVASIGPLDSISKPSSVRSYEIFSNYTKITSKARVESGADATIDVVSFYDGLGRLIQSKSLGPLPGQYIVSGQKEYDQRGLVIKQYQPRLTSNDLNTLDPVDVSQPNAQAQYDAMGRTIMSINPDGSYSSMVYDRWVTSAIDANGHMQKAYMDAYGRLVQKEEYAGADGRDPINYPAISYKLYATTSYSYDAKGNLKSVIDAKGNVTNIQYDNLGRKVGMDDPDMGRWGYSYDLNGNLKGQLDAKGTLLYFNYDSLNRLQSKSSYVGAGQLNVKLDDKLSVLASYSYDGLSQAYGQGRLTSVSYGYTIQNAAFTYDQLGREIISSKLIDSTNYRVSRQYDALNRLKQLEYPDGAKLKYSYNQAGQIASVSDAIDPGKIYVKSISYNAQGQMTQVEYGNGTITGYSYDPRNKQLKQIYSSNLQGQKLQDLNYSYDALGQIIKIEDKLNTQSQEFKYDEQNRLIYAKGAYGQKLYQYDEIGNILQKDGIGYRYGEANSRTDGSKAGPHAVTSLSDGTIFKYDANGNMVNIIKGAETTVYVYDEQNRLTNVYITSPGKANVNVSSYAYDGDGGRTKKTVYRRDKAVYSLKNPTSLLFKDYNGKPWPATSNNPTIVSTKYLGNLYEEESAATNGVQRKSKYIYLGSTRVAAVSADGTIMYYHNDHLGSTNVLTDKAGLARELTEYDPFGLIIRHETYGDASAQMWNFFNGKALDDETGLMYYGARYYNPKLGRFITPDTLVPRPGNPQEFNRYSYCLNNPINMVDPSGHKSWWKKFWGGVKDFVRDYGGLFGLSGGLANGIINNNWKPLQNQLIAGASAFVLSGFNPVAGMAAMMTTSVLDSKPGQQVTKFVAAEVMDDMLGMRPGTAYVWARIGLQIAGTLAVENMLKGAIADPATASQINDKASEANAIGGKSKGYDPAGGRYPGGGADRGFDLTNSDVKVMALTVKGQTNPTAVLGTGKFAGGMLLHTGAVSSSFPGGDIVRLPFGNNFLNGYATVFGVCHQATNATLLASGISSTVWDLAPHWSTFASTITYGNYGGQLSNYVYSGVRTDLAYDKNR